MLKEGLSFSDNHLSEKEIRNYYPLPNGMEEIAPYFKNPIAKKHFDILRTGFVNGEFTEVNTHSGVYISTQYMAPTQALLRTNKLIEDSSKTDPNKKALLLFVEGFYYIIDGHHFTVRCIKNGIDRVLSDVYHWIPK